MTNEPLTWPSGQRRYPLRATIQFTGETCRAARALLNWSADRLAHEAGAWPRDVSVTSSQVEAFEAGADLDELKHAAICEALYREGYGVIVVAEAAAGAGVRFALNAEKRAAGTFSDRKWARVEAAHAARVKLQEAWWRHLEERHGPHWIANPSLPLVPPFSWTPDARTDGQSSAHINRGDRAP